MKGQSCTNDITQFGPSVGRTLQWGTVLCIALALGSVAGLLAARTNAAPGTSVAAAPISELEAEIAGFSESPVTSETGLGHQAVTTGEALESRGNTQPNAWAQVGFTEADLERFREVGTAIADRRERIDAAPAGLNSVDACRRAPVRQALWMWSRCCGSSTAVSWSTT